MEKLLSILRRILFLSIVILLIMKKQITLFYFVIGYIVVIILSVLYYHFLYKKFPNMKYPFISRLWRVDICDPIFNYSRDHYYVGSRLGGLWDHRNEKHSSFAEFVKSFFVRIFVYLLIFIIIYAIIYTFAR